MAVLTQVNDIHMALNKITTTFVMNFKNPLILWSFIVVFYFINFFLQITFNGHS